MALSFLEPSGSEELFLFLGDMRLESLSKSLLNLALFIIFVGVLLVETQLGRRAPSGFGSLAPSDRSVVSSAQPLTVSIDSVSSILSISELLRSLYTISLVPFTLFLRAAICRGDFRILVGYFTVESL